MNNILLKIINILLIIILILFNCVKIEEVEEKQQAVKETLDRFYFAQEQENMNLLVSTFANDSTVIVLGPCAENRIQGWEFIEQNWRHFFDIASDIKIWRRDEIIHTDDTRNIAWVSSLNRLEAEIHSEKVSYYYFFSAVLKKIDLKWSLIQTHSEIPCENFSKITIDKIKPELPSFEEVETPNISQTPDTFKTKPDSIKKYDY